MKTRRAFCALLLMASAALFPTPAAAATADTVVATHLDAPRGVAFLNGRLVVAEAGHGGPYCDGVPGTPGTTCIGTSSRISSVNSATGLPEPMVTGLFSALEWHGPSPDQLGVDGISARGGKIFGILALAPQLLEGIACPSEPLGADCRAAKRQAGHLILASPSGSWRDVASVGGHDYEYTLQFPSAAQEHDANPYGVLAGAGGAYVADAGANTLDFVSNGGRTTVLQHFPFRQNAFPSDEVPDCVARTNGALWVGTLAGHLYRIEDGSVTMVEAPALKHVTGCAADESNNLYFVNMFTTPFPSPFSGNVVKLNADEGTWSVVNTAPLDFPNMVAVGPDGNLYVSADSVCPATGGPPFCPFGGTVHRLSVASGEIQRGEHH